MLCVNSVLIRVLLFVIVVSGGANSLIPRICNPEQSCVFLSSCKTLNYNFTSLSERDRQHYFQSTVCNKTDPEPMICCSNHVPETDFPDSDHCGKSPGHQKILDGENAEIDDYPWMVLLEYRNRDTSEITYHCAGSLINNRYVLTAAHCLANNDNLTYVHLGKYDSNAEENCNEDDCAHPTVTVGIDEIISHERYSGTSDTKNDIALIRLSRIVYYTDFIQPICLPWTVRLTPSFEGESLEIGGWGKGAKSSVKQKLYLPAFNFDECAERYRRDSIIRIDETTQMCAGGIPNQGACAGDSGGPLMAVVTDNTYAIEGIISTGYNMCDLKRDTTYPTIFTKVSKFESWIKSKIRP